MHIALGRTADLVTRDQLLALVEPRHGVTIDVGAGDGAWAYRYASAHPERFVIALNPVRENMREWSAKAGRKAEKGGLANVLFVVASMEAPPEELRGVADEIFVTLPWGSLMRGIILGDDVVLGGIASLGGEGASVRIVLNTRIFDDPVPLDVRDLPEVTPAYVTETLGSAFERNGLRVVKSRWMDADEVAAIGTTWGKRLSHRSPPRSVLIEATVHGSTDGADGNR
jgi:16S rRNA (adenine(1408)-N(1))-methyltransferase